MEVLTLKVNNQELDLDSSEKIVQTFSLFNINDITSRQSEYSNSFKVPKTTNNLNIVANSDYINSVDNFPFQKHSCEIIINGFIFKRGYIELVEISNEITLRFYTGNIGFYDALKDKTLKDIDANNNPNLITTWDLFNVLGSRAATEDVFFPLIDYNGMSDLGSTVDVRRLLPAYYKSSIIKAMVSDAGYDLINELEGDALVEYNHDILPTSNNKLVTDAFDIENNSYEGSMEDGTGDTDLKSLGADNVAMASNEVYTNALLTQFYGNINYSTYVSGNIDRYNEEANNLDFFRCSLTGSYDIEYNLDVYALVVDTWSSIPLYTASTNFYLYVQINGVLSRQVGSSISVNHSYPNTTASNSVNLTGTISLNLNSNDIVRLVAGFDFVYRIGAFNDPSVNKNSRYSIKILDGSTFGINLSDNITFGTQINPAQCLSPIKQNEFLKDTCIRYCILPFVDEDTKTVYLKEFKSISDNISNSKNWTSKVDETNDASLTFTLGNYARKNLYKHKEDKSVLTIPNGTDSSFLIQNENLIAEKTIYESPFAPSEIVTRLVDSEMIAIDLYDGAAFTKDVVTRTCYTRLIDKSIDFTDGTTTTTVTTDIPHTWFISNARPYNAGWENNLLNSYSTQLINILQSPRVLKIDIRLTLIDILQLNYFYPIYLEQYNAYFFISSINQYDYTSNDATEVELIKIN